MLETQFLTTEPININNIKYQIFLLRIQGLVIER